MDETINGTILDPEEAVKAFGYYPHPVSEISKFRQYQKGSLYQHNFSKPKPKFLHKIFQIHHLTALAARLHQFLLKVLTIQHETLPMLLCGLYLRSSFALSILAMTQRPWVNQ
jgi:hypothetical protein